MSISQKRWAARALIGLVLLWNVQCAAAFLLSPGAFTAGFELTGVPGEGMIRGMGILFLMWNVPYAAALLDPVRRRFSLFEAIAMQAVGLAGESLLLASLPPGHAAIRESVTRFIWFDGAGLALLALAAVVSRLPREPVSGNTAVSPSGKS